MLRCVARCAKGAGGGEEKLAVLTANLDEAKAVLKPSLASPTRASWATCENAGPYYLMKQSLN